MRWADRLARLSTPYSESSDSSETPPRGDFPPSPPTPIAPKGSLAFANGANGAFGNGVEREKSPDAIPDEVEALASAPLPPGLQAPSDADVETLAAALMAESARNPAVRRIDEARATLYYRGEAKRRLDLLHQRARDATSGEDIERQAIMAEEHQPMASHEAHKKAVAGLLLAASPLAGLPGVVACRGCGRSVWCSPSWKGPPPRDLCWNCSREVTP